MERSVRSQRAGGDREIIMMRKRIARMEEAAENEKASHKRALSKRAKDNQSLQEELVRVKESERAMRLNVIA